MKEETPSEGRAVLAAPRSRIAPPMSPTLFVRGNDFETGNVRNLEVRYEEIKSAKNRSEYESQAKNSGRGELGVVLQALLIEFQGPEKGR